MQPNLNIGLIENLLHKCLNTIMKLDTSKRTSIIETTPVDKVDVDVLKRRVIHQKKKEKMQSRIILASAIVSLGVISYFAG